MPRRVHGDRAMLNLAGHHSTAAIVAEIEDTRGWPAGKGRHGKDLDRYNATPTTVFKLTDCSESVNIEFDVDTENSLENSLYKVDTMISALRKFRKGLVVEGERAQKRFAAMPQSQRFGR